ncbi:MAG: FAD:protein FMN transferase [Gammaproteobacteria bacterium]|nr:FAD:protein FMN transferase [Gammaproteobacteria bacterium]
MNDIRLKRDPDCWRGSFIAMASPCEVLMEVDEEELAGRVLETVVDEARRIEAKFSRYRDDNIIARINSAQGDSVTVDEESARLLDFADQLYQMSDGLFDITSGVLRKVWRFDGSDRIPGPRAIQQVLKNVGWHKVTWRNSQIILDQGMEIDLGGLGKEYAVDRCITLARELTDKSVLINFGGDLAVSCQRQGGKCWSVGRLVTGSDQAVALFQLFTGAIATSGDANRYLLKDGVRYSHVLNPKSGWPVVDAPHTVSVAAATCTEAGMFSTLAMLQGPQAREFLSLQGVEYWVN